MPNPSILLAATIGASVSQPLLTLSRRIVSRLEAQWREDFRLALQESGRPVAEPMADVASTRRASPRYASVLAAFACASGFGVCVWSFGWSIASVFAVINISTLFMLSATDFESLLLPDVLTIPLIWGGLLVNIGGQFASTSSAIIGACAGYMLIWSLRWVTRILTSRERLGLGDAKLTAAAGAWLGWQAIPEVALIAILSYLIYERWRKVRGLPESALRPLGPHLALGFAYVLCAEPHLLPSLLPG